MVDKKEKMKYLLIGMVTLFVIFGSYTIITSQPTTSEPTMNISERSEYCNKYGCVNKIAFSKLPDFPEDFYEVKLKADRDKYPTMTEHFSCTKWDQDYSKCLEWNPDENYYLQPEFYGKPSTWNTNFWYYIQGISGYSGVTGFGSQPISSTIILEKGIDQFKIATFIYSSWYIKTYQGMELKSFYIATATNKKTGEIVVQNPEIVKDYFDIKITPDNFLLGRTYPIFEPTWSQKVIFDVKSTAPKGKYVISFMATPPSEEYDTKWFNQYSFSYHPISNVGVGGGLYQIFVVVK